MNIVMTLEMAAECHPDRIGVTCGEQSLGYAALLQASDLPLVQPVIERISRRRLSLLTDAYREAGFDARRAAHRARLAYTAYSGFLQLNQRHGMPRMDQDEYQAYVDHVITTLVPD